MNSSASWWSRVNSFVPSPKAAACTLMVGALSVLAGWLHITAYFVAAALFIFLAVTILDILSLPGVHDLEITRIVPRLTEGESSIVRLSLKVAPGAKMPPIFRQITARDDYPAKVKVKQTTLSAVWNEDTVELSYALTPLGRGTFEFGDVHVRISGRFGLLQRQYKIRARQRSAVWPDTRLTEAKQVALQKALQIQGHNIRRVSGGHTEFAHIRDFAIGDDPRHVNWFATARRGTLMRNVYQPERGQHVILVLDCGRTMGIAQNGGKTRLDLALEAVLLTASAALKNGDEVSIIAFSDQIHAHLQGMKGSSGMRQITETVYDLQPTQSFSGTHLMADRIYAHHKRRSLLILFSDLTDLARNDLFDRNIRLLERRHTCVVASFTDEAMEERLATQVKSLHEAVVVGAIAGFLIERHNFKKHLGKRAIEVIESKDELFSGALQAYVRYKNKIGR